MQKHDSRCMDWSKGLFLVMMTALLVSGCAFTKDYATIDYLPETGVSEVAGADSVTVSVRIADARQVGHSKKISHKKNGFGINCASIMANNDVLQLVEKAIETELRNRGFAIGEGDVQANVTVDKFYNNWDLGFWSASADSEVIINVQVKNPSSRIVYARSVSGKNVEPGVHVFSGENAGKSLEKALKKAVSKLMNDPSFMSALIEAGT